jgi:CBS domain-containing protein
MTESRILVRDYMSRKVVKLRPDMEILRAVHHLIDGRVSGAPVVDESGNVVGMLTERDCMKVVLNAAYHQEHGGLVREFMATNVEDIEPDLSIVDAAKQFYEKKYLRYPVVENGQLIGVLSRSDVMRAMGDYWKI